ncbi:discoidin domain-containing protein [Micromonospora sp. M12]
MAAVRRHRRWGHSLVQHGQLAVVLGHEPGQRAAVIHRRSTRRPPHRTWAPTWPPASRPPDRHRAARRRARRRRSTASSAAPASGAPRGRHQVPPGGPGVQPEHRVLRGETRGLGGENTGWNTSAFTIQTSTDGTTWTTRTTVSGNRSSRTYHPISAVAARYVRLNATTPANDGNGAARIDEFEVYGGSGPTNLALNRPATADSQCSSTEGPEGRQRQHLRRRLRQMVLAGRHQVPPHRPGRQPLHPVRHGAPRGAGGEDSAWNTRDFDLQVSADGSAWTTAAQVRGNTTNVSNHRWPSSAGMCD